MKKIMVSIKENSLNAVRYAAYTCSGDCAVHIKPAGDDYVELCFAENPGKSAEAIVASFFQELSDEKIREQSRDMGLAGAEMILRNLFSACIEGTPPPKEDAAPALTPAQEKELDELIAEVEAELKSEMAHADNADPYHIKDTWEQTNKKQETEDGK